MHVIFTLFSVILAAGLSHNKNLTHNKGIHNLKKGLVTQYICTLMRFTLYWTEWLECWTCNLEALNSSPTLTARLTLLSLIYIICFRHLLGPTSISAINTAEGKWRNYLLFFMTGIKSVPGKPSPLRRYHWFSRKMTSEKRAQKFHTDDASLPRSRKCFQSEAPPRYGEWRLISLEFLHSFNRRLFAGI